MSKRKSNTKNKKPSRKQSRKRTKADSKNRSNRRNVRTKGIRYIAEKLNKYYPKRYKNKQSALPRAREIVEQLKASGQKVTWRNARELEVKKRVPKEGVPELTDFLATPQPYYELINYPKEIVKLSNRLWLVSEVSAGTFDEIEGGSEVDFDDSFHDFVTYCNNMLGLQDEEQKKEDEGSGRFDYNVVCTPPMWNKQKKRYESKIISCTSDGDKFDYGFNPEQPTKEPLELIMSDGTPQEPKPKQEEPKQPPKDTDVPKEPSPPETDKIKAETERLKAETELERAKAKANLTKMFMEGKITKDEFKDFLSSI